MEFINQRKIHEKNWIIGIIVLIWYSLILVVVPMTLQLYDRCHPTKNVCYPSESIFFPYPLAAIVVLSLGMSYVGLLLGQLSWRRRAGELGNFLALIGLGVSIVGLFSPFLTSFPLLGYEVRSNGTGEQVSVNIWNRVVVSAKDILVSINSNDDNITFSNISIEPLLPTTSYQTDGDAFFNLDRILPFSSVTITANLSRLSDNDIMLMTYVNSESWVGYSNLDQIIILATAAFILPLAYLLDRTTGIFGKFLGTESKTSYYSEDDIA